MSRISEEQFDSMLKNYCGRTAQTAFQKPAVRRFPAKQLVLSAAIVLVITSVALVFWLTSVNARPAKNAYSFSAEKLAAFCKQESIADKTAQQEVGTWVPYLAYADGQTAVFGVAKGLFVFDYQNGELINTFDLDKIGVPAFGQGDNISSIIASDDGKFVLLYSHIEFEENHYREEYREVKLETGEISLIDSKEDFEKRHGIFQTNTVSMNERKELPGWLFSGCSAIVEANEYVFAIDFDNGKGNLSTLSLVVMDAQTGEIKSVLSVFKNIYK